MVNKKSHSFIGICLISWKNIGLSQQGETSFDNVTMISFYTPILFMCVSIGLIAIYP